MKSNTNEEALGMLGTPYDMPAEVRKAYDNYNSGRLTRDKFIEQLERLMWKSKTNAPQYFAGLKKVTDWLKQKGSDQEQGGIKLKDEGYGAVYTKDIKKDPKHTTNKTTGKVNRWTVKFDENMQAAGAQTPPTEKMISHLIYSLKPDVAIVFYSLTNPEFKVYVRRTHDKSFEVIDSGGGEYVLKIPQDREKLKILISQIAMKHRRYNQYQTFKTISTQPEYSSSMKTSELKEVIKELVLEMWADTGTGAGGGDKEKESGDLKPTGRGHAAGSDKFVDLYKGNREGPIDPLPSAGGAMSENTRELYEAKGETKKDKLKNIVREAINEVEFDRDYDGETERQLVNSIATIARTAVNKTLHPQIMQKYLKEIDRLASLLIDIYKTSGK